MKIGIEAERANIPNPTGVEHYAKQLILALAKIDGESGTPKNSYILYLRSQPANWIKELPSNFSYKVIPFPIFWTQLRISWEMIMHPVDALFIMASALPLIHPRNSTVTIHDIAWDFYPETFSKFMLNYLRFSTWFAVIFAKNIIAVSEQTKRDLIKKYNLSGDKVRVIYHGFDLAQEMAHPDDHTSSAFQAETKKEQQKFALLPDKFILYIGTLQPRKNIVGLIDAFLQMKKQANVPHSLVIAGSKGWLYDQIMEKIKDNPEVIYFGRVQDRFALIKKADLLVLPSFYEGFGLPILEAFAMDVPVATANISSMPEVAGDAAEYFDPKDLITMTAALRRVLMDPLRHQMLVKLGKQRLAQFTWQKCAEETLRTLVS